MQSTRAWQTKFTALAAAPLQNIYLRDGEVEMLLLTGMRHGTEAMGICWKHFEWHTDKGVRYLHICINGKTGGRWLIAKHKAVEVLRRLHARQTDVKNIAFDDLFSSCAPAVIQVQRRLPATKFEWHVQAVDA